MRSWYIPRQRNWDHSRLGNRANASPRRSPARQRRESWWPRRCGPATSASTTLTRIREIISDDPPQLRTLRLIQSILTMRAMGQLTDDDMSRNETLAAAWRLTEEIPPPAAMVQEIAAGVANVNAEDPDHADRFPTREESYAALGIDPPPPNQDDGEA